MLYAVGATGSLGFLIIGLALVWPGVSIVISQYFGAKDYDNVRKGFATAVGHNHRQCFDYGVSSVSFSCRTCLKY